ncbi:Hypothetical protein, putative [Bodo saltans]|uniref:Uncharacterized protein n=1 Tax=Bodo saltans TaxID=75058 RepID=A0A0S4IWI5_BODSA|nr:Hypothetical protein, putative [Bodo saltans]|eukprot:CUG29495.1 Hypothetical protein, putative [Bodo saltans]
MGAYLCRPSCCCFKETSVKRSSSDTKRKRGERKKSRRGHRHSHEDVYDETAESHVAPVTLAADEDNESRRHRHGKKKKSKNIPTSTPERDAALIDTHNNNTSVIESRSPVALQLSATNSRRRHKSNVSFHDDFTATNSDQTLSILKAEGATAPASRSLRFPTAPTVNVFRGIVEGDSDDERLMMNERRNVESSGEDEPFPSTNFDDGSSRHHQRVAPDGTRDDEANGGGNYDDRRRMSAAPPNVTTTLSPMTPLSFRRHNGEEVEEEDVNDDEDGKEEQQQHLASYQNFDFVAAAATTNEAMSRSHRRHNHNEPVAYGDVLLYDSATAVSASSASSVLSSPRSPSSSPRDTSQPFNDQRRRHDQFASDSFSSAACQQSPFNNSSPSTDSDDDNDGNLNRKNRPFPSATARTAATRTLGKMNGDELFTSFATMEDAGEVLPAGSESSSSKSSALNSPHNDRRHREAFSSSVDTFSNVSHSPPLLPQPPFLTGQAQSYFSEGDGGTNDSVESTLSSNHHYHHSAAVVAQIANEINMNDCLTVEEYLTALIDQQVAALKQQRRAERISGVAPRAWNRKLDDDDDDVVVRIPSGNAALLRMLSDAQSIHRAQYRASTYNTNTYVHEANHHSKQLQSTCSRCSRCGVCSLHVPRCCATGLHHSHEKKTQQQLQQQQHSVQDNGAQSRRTHFCSLVPSHEWLCAVLLATSGADDDTTAKASMSSSSLFWEGAAQSVLLDDVFRIVTSIAPDWESALNDVFGSRCFALLESLTMWAGVDFIEKNGQQQNQERGSGVSFVLHRKSKQNAWNIGMISSRDRKPSADPSAVSLGADISYSERIFQEYLVSPPLVPHRLPVISPASTKRDRQLLLEAIDIYVDDKMRNGRSSLPHSCRYTGMPLNLLQEGPLSTTAVESTSKHLGVVFATSSAATSSPQRRPPAAASDFISHAQARFVSASSLKYESNRTTASRQLSQHEGTHHEKRLVEEIPCTTTTNESLPASTCREKS